MKHYTINKKLVRTRFTRAIGSYREEATIQAAIAKHMVHLLSACIPQHLNSVFEFGCGNGGFTRLFLNQFQPQELWLNDLCPEMANTLTDLLISSSNYHFISGDVEQIDLPGAMELVVSCSALQWLEHPIAFIQHCARQIRPDGFIAFSTFGPNNMQEISSITNTSLPYIRLTEWIDGLKEHYTILHASEKTYKLNFQDPLQVLRHLKQTGVNGINHDPWNKEKLNHFSNEYISRYGQTNYNGEKYVSLTYHPIYIIAQKL